MTEKVSMYFSCTNVVKDILQKAMVKARADSRQEVMVADIEDAIIELQQRTPLTVVGPSGAMATMKRKGTSCEITLNDKARGKIEVSDIAEAAGSITLTDITTLRDSADGNITILVDNVNRNGRARLENLVRKIIGESDKSDALPFSSSCGPIADATEPAATDNPIDHPSYYNRASMEVIDGIDRLKLEFVPGTIFKYLARHRGKNGYEDLKKASWYIEWLQQNSPCRFAGGVDYKRFDSIMKDCGFGPLERMAMFDLEFKNYDSALEIINTLSDQIYGRKIGKQRTARKANSYPPESLN